MKTKETDKNADSHCHVTASEVIAAEEQYINDNYPKDYREDYKDYCEQTSNELPVYGLALSGGGIRSASFCIGVIQALQNEDLANEVWKPNPTAEAPSGVTRPSFFKKLRYVSAVSGGSYTGSALSWYQQKFGFFPFGSVNSYRGHVSQNQQEASTVSNPPLEDTNEILAYLRTHGKYLTPKGIGVPGLIASALMSVLHSTLVYFLVFSCLFFIAVQALYFFPFSQCFIQSPLFFPLEYLLKSATDISTIPDIRRALIALAFHLTLLFVFVFFVITLLYGFASYFRKEFSSAHNKRVLVTNIQGHIVLLALGSVALMLIPIIVQLLYGSSLSIAGDMTEVGIMSGSGIASILLTLRKLKSSVSSSSKPGLLEQLLSIIAVPVSILFLLTFAYLFAELVLLFHSFKELLITIVIIIISGVLALCVNINQICPHKLYRDRLMEAFLKTPGVPETEPLAKRTHDANISYLKDMLAGKNNNQWTPYTLINCNVILSNALSPKYRGRCGDSFLLSPLYCGSTATNYLSTESFADGKMTLATAMAISGAAANPHAGNFGEGKTTQKSTSFLMAFFGLRLGYWVFNPSNDNCTIEKYLKPNYVNPGLPSLFDRNNSESSMLIELSDGGHFDNTGVYELIRRRVPYIILADGGADPDETFDSLGNVIERVRVDFGAIIRFSIEEFDLCGILPGSQVNETLGGKPLFDNKYELSERGYAIGEIVYPGDDKATGKFVYIKTCMTRGLPSDIYSYKSAHQEFPHEPTSDQFFDERQFESYRELGYQLTKQMLLNKAAMTLLP